MYLSPCLSIAEVCFGIAPDVAAADALADGFIFCCKLGSGSGRTAGTVVVTCHGITTGIVVATCGGRTAGIVVATCSKLVTTCGRAPGAVAATC